MPKPVFITRSVPRLTLQGARLVLAAATRRAMAVGVPMDLAVVDDAGHLLAFNRMDGAKLSSIDIAISKAWTAACTRRGTHEYAEIAGPGKPAFGIHVSNGGRFMIVGGGLPIVLGGQVVGGIGCSSGTVAQDRDVASAGIRALLARALPRVRRPSRRAGVRRGPRGAVARILRRV
ncbi:MAG TPA: heme-binding protein [Patescibacteria group bacterium]|nr:heme-binding protein [Patescibacteria group bacterium]